MAWFSGRVTLGNFPDFAGAVNKLSESVKNIEKNFDNALRSEDQPGGSTSTIEASPSWPPELMAFMGKKDDNGTVEPSKKLESSEKHEPLNPPSVLKEKEGADADDSTNTTEEHPSPVREASVETLKPEEHRVFPKEKEGVDADDSTNTTQERSSPVIEASVESLKPEEHQVFPKEKEGVDADDSTNTSKECPSYVKEASVETLKSEDHQLLSKEKEGADADVSTNSTEKHLLPIREQNVKTLKDEEHQEHPAETNNVILKEADSSTEKPADTNIGIHDQADGTIALPMETENIAEKPVETNIETSHEATTTADNHSELEADSQAEQSVDDAVESEIPDHVQHRESSEISSPKIPGSIDDEPTNPLATSSELNEVHTAPNLQNSEHGLNRQDEEATTSRMDASYDGQAAIEAEPHEAQSAASEGVDEGQLPLQQSSDEASEMVPEVVPKDDHENAKVHIMKQPASDDQREVQEQRPSSGSNPSNNTDSVVELENVKREMQKMEAALLGAARQAQAKADEIASLMNENEQLRSIVEDQKRKSSEAETDSLREAYQQRVSTLERKVYALTRERDTLRREQNKKNDATALLKEKDEIITQVMAEGEELSKKQAVQESTIRKLRAQIREFEEEKKGLITKLQVEENRVETIKRDKAATEKLLQETIEKNRAELAAQKEYYTNALSASKEAEALAKAQANNEARTELENHLREVEERESMLVQTLEELRQTLSRKEQEAVFREDMLRKDIEDLQKRYQASERRCEELVTQIPESTRPLLRQIEAMQETTARKAEAWTAVERSLNIRLQEAEAKADAAEERERSVNERLSQTLSRINVLEAQISCLRSEQTQLTRSLEKERQRAAESRQDYLALKEEADTHEGHVNQLEKEITELKRKHKRELHEALTQQELLRQDIEREKDARLELEKTARSLPFSTVPRQSSVARTKSASENGLVRRLSSASGLSSIEESFFLQASLDSSETFSERRNRGEPTISPYYLKSMTPNTFEVALRQKEGELASYMSRLASMESIRDSLSEGLVKMTEECEKLRSEATQLPGVKAELEALRRRHSAALELMGERDEELEELRADIVDMKEMYREQVTMLVNKVQTCSSIGVA